MADNEAPDESDRPDEAERAAIKARVAEAESHALVAPQNAANAIKPKPTRQLRSGKADFEHGHFKVKVHQVLEADLDDLGRMNRDASILTATATGFGGFALEVTKDLLLSGGAPADTLAFFVGVDAVCIGVAIYAGIGAVGKWRERGNKLRHIKRQTKFVSDTPNDG